MNHTQALNPVNPVRVVVSLIRLKKYHLSRLKECKKILYLSQSLLEDVIGILRKMKEKNLTLEEAVKIHTRIQKKVSQEIGPKFNYPIRYVEALLEIVNVALSCNEKEPSATDEQYAEAIEEFIQKLEALV